MFVSLNEQTTITEMASLREIDVALGPRESLLQTRLCQEEDGHRERDGGGGGE